MAQKPLVYLSICFAFVAAIFIASGVNISADSRWSLHTAHSLLQGQTGRLDAYRTALEKEDNYAIEMIGGHPRTIFPMGVSILAMPFVAVATAIDPTLADQLKHSTGFRTEKVIASIFCALAAALFCWLIGSCFAT